MSRAVKFRGKALMSVEELDALDIQHNNGWVFGNLIMDGKNAFVVGCIADVTDEYIHPEWWVGVDLETVGQFTGLKDKTGVEIYDGDVFEIDYGIGHKWREEVIFHQGCFMAGDENLLINVVDHGTVIGNIYEHPHLLEVAQ